MQRWFDAEPWTVRISDLQGEECNVVDVDPVAATILAVVNLLSKRGVGIDRGQRSSLPVSFEVRPAASQAHLAPTSPTGDLLRWARLEPVKFADSESSRPRLLFGNAGYGVLTPAARAMVVMQFMPASAVSEATVEKGWSFGLITKYEEPYTCRIQAAASMAEASFPTVGPACVKAYLRALETLN